jgi:hypothetical protein
MSKAVNLVVVLQAFTSHVHTLSALKALLSHTLHNTITLQHPQKSAPPTQVDDVYITVRDGPRYHESD